MAVSVFVMDYNEAVAAAIVAECEVLGISKKELSRRSGIPAATLYRFMRGEREIRVGHLYKIATALELLPEEIAEHATLIYERDSKRERRGRERGRGDRYEGTFTMTRETQDDDDNGGGGLADVYSMTSY